MLCTSPVQRSALFGKYNTDIRCLKSIPARNLQFQVSSICRIYRICRICRKRGSRDLIKVEPVCSGKSPVPIEEKEIEKRVYIIKNSKILIKVSNNGIE